MRELLPLLAAAGLVACASPAATTDGPDPAASRPPPEVGKHVVPVRSVARPAATQPIYYYGGPVMTSTANHIYYIWYGDWSGSPAPAILDDLARGLGGSPYFNINTSYYSRTAWVKNLLGFGGEAQDAGSYGTSLDDSAVESVVSDAITRGDLPEDPQGIYLVLGAPGVDETSGMCSSYCGWHYYTYVGSSWIKYAFIGNAANCPNSCAAQQTSPNGDYAADAMASVISHEVEETVTDPYVSAWMDTSGEENGDKCAWTWGTTSAAANGAAYNVMLGDRPFLIQQNWDASRQACAISR